MSQEQTQQIKVTLEQLVLLPADIDQLYAILGEVPHKHAVQIFDFINGKIKTQLEAKVAKLQKEYDEKLAAQNALKAIPAVDEVAEVV